MISWVDSYVFQNLLNTFIFVWKESWGSPTVRSKNEFSQNANLTGRNMFCTSQKLRKFKITILSLIKTVFNWTSFFDLTVGASPAEFSDENRDYILFRDVERCGITSARGISFHQFHRFLEFRTGIGPDPHSCAFWCGQSLVPSICKRFR
jgi:hypothetical protein